MPRLAPTLSPIGEEGADARVPGWSANDDFLRLEPQASLQIPLKPNSDLLLGVVVGGP